MHNERNKQILKETIKSEKWLYKRILNLEINFLKCICTVHTRTMIFTATANSENIFNKYKLPTKELITTG